MNKRPHVEIGSQKELKIPRRKTSRFESECGHQTMDGKQNGDARCS